MNNQNGICELWASICFKFGEIYGIPLPRDLVTLGDPTKGWFIKLNNSTKIKEKIPVFSIQVGWNGWPAGIIDVNGGLIAAGELVNESKFRKWLEEL